MKIERLLPLALIVAVASSAPAIAAGTFSSAGRPHTITVAATAQVTPSNLVADLPVERVLVSRLGKTANAALGADASASLRAMLPSLGLNSSAIASMVPLESLSKSGHTAYATYAILRVPPNRVVEVSAALTKAGWDAKRVTLFEAADPDAARTQALVAAERIAQARAAAIARAAGVHLGALLAVKPIVLDDFIGGESFKLPSFPFASTPATILPQPLEVKAAALFTFSIH
ncbi:MAG: hypothetical protein HKL92_03620 [Candidatus Eremiobacteraeota bacterium]|nr:hypothetical protein [Candidatus Eremiobacteraeota bacterium]NNM92408.1 hypothetical protein [Candidatus Eremiobacteraeota bacterium]